MGPFSLSQSQRNTLDAVARRIVPSAYEGDAVQQGGLTARVEARIAGMASDKQRDIARALSAFGLPGAGWRVGTLRRFSNLSSENQNITLRHWGASRMPLQRTIYQALRRLVLYTYYAMPSAQRGIGHLGPLHGRTPSHPFEGPAVGQSADREPVARQDANATRTVLPVASADDGEWKAQHSILPGVILGGSLAPDLKIRADVVVIGSGAGGAVAAARLAEAGQHVVILEEGGFYTVGDFSEDESEMTGKLYAEQGFRSTEDQSIAMLQGRGVGGGTNINWMIMLRPADHVLDEWAHRFGTTGMRPAELRPVFDRIEREVHASPVPDDSHSPNNRILLDGAKKLGWSAYGGSINAKACVRSGACGLGCRYDAKQGSLATYIPRALKAGAQLYCDVRAERIEIIERGGPFPKKRITARVLDRKTGQPRGTITVEVPVVVLAGGAVETPLLLQRSGLGGGGVGRYLRLHPTAPVLGIYEQDIYAPSGIPLSAVCNEFSRSDANGYGFWVECMPLYPAFTAAMIPGFGDAHREFIGHYTKFGAFIVLVRDGADLDLSNGSVATDRSGRGRIHYRLGKADERHLAEGIKAAAKLHLAGGAREVRTLHTTPAVISREADVQTLDSKRYGPNELLLSSAHVNGTCRLGIDRRTSGVDPDGERHGAPGLFVCDGSLIPTGLGVNPQETIMALSTVISERIAHRR